MIYDINGTEVATGGNVSYGNIAVNVSGSNLPVYNARDNGISPDNAASDNTAALQTLMDAAHAAGGGIIFFPVGTYNFSPASDGARYAVLARSYVSVYGENMEKTVLKLSADAPYSMFYNLYGTAESPAVEGVTYQNFTVDGSACVTTFAVYAKAIYIQYIKHSVFRNLILRDTAATSLGIDYLDDVTIDSVTCIKSGATMIESATLGSAGIGIGTGKWEEENFQIVNCKCIDCGLHGIFIESQDRSADVIRINSSGQIISNNIVRGSCNGGIDIVAGKNVIVSNNLIYGCGAAGISVTQEFENILIANNVINKNSSGISVSVSGSRTRVCEGVTISNNQIKENAHGGITVMASGETCSLTQVAIMGNHVIDNGSDSVGIQPMGDKITGLAIVGNVTSGHKNGIHFDAYTYTDVACMNNILYDGKRVYNSTFAGNTDYQADLA